MGRKVYLCLLILCGISIQGLQGTSALSEENKDLHIRKKRVIGSEPIPLEQAPYAVNIFANKVNTCTGSLLSQGFALTAAHCFNHKDGAFYEMLSGSSISCEGSPHNITQIIPHPYLRSDDESHDVALFKFLPIINFQLSINRPIKLYNGNLPRNSRGTVASWGCHIICGTQKIFPDQLQSATVQILSLQECQNHYSQYENFVITQQYICTASVTGGPQFNLADSGAPLVVNGRLVGVMSWGVEHNFQLPAVFISMLHQDFRSWISQYVPNALA